MTSRQVAIFPFMLVFSMVLAADECDTNHDSRQGAVNSVVFYTSSNENNQKTIEKLEEKMDQLEKRMAEVLEMREDIKNSVQEEVKEVTKSFNINDTNNTDVDTQQPMGQYNPPPFLHSCDEVKSTWPDSVSDYYLIADSTGLTRHVYCSMDNTCGDAKGGWLRVGYLNMSDPSEQCPSGFRLNQVNGIRACGRQSSGCQSVKFPSYSISYSQVCGRVTGYQKGSPDAMAHTSRNNINGAYVDGVSITRGNSRQHVWTFIAALRENSHHNKGHEECPCAPGSPVTLQSFVGNDYFCESGNPKAGHDATTLHTNDPLWDGKQCGLIEKACCLAPGIPWFNKVLPQPTTDYIELRVCADSAVNGNEDIPVGHYEIYVK